MDGKQSPELAQILNAIKEGGFGKDELVQRLNALVDREFAQTDRPADMELIQACQDILYRLHHQGEAYVSNREASLVKAHRKLRKRLFSLPSFNPVTRVAALLILLIGGGILFDVFISGEHLFGISTRDEQQYVVEGTDIDSIVAQEVEAEQSTDMKILSTVSFTEAVEAFGSTPPTPTWLPEGWDVLDYYVVISKRAERFEVQYSKSSEEEYIKYSVENYHNVASAQMAFEQNQSGRKHTIGNKSVYVSINTGSCVAVWLTDSTCYSVTGPVSESDMCQIIDSINMNGESQ